LAFPCSNPSSTVSVSPVPVPSAHWSADHSAIALDASKSSGCPILGVAPFALALPHVGLLGTAVLSVFIALIMASAFPAILVYATELFLEGGLIAGLFFGLAFGLAGIGSAVLGKLRTRPASNS